MASSPSNDDSSAYTRVSLENAHTQEQSPFFSLPGEVRQSIYAYVTASYEDKTRLYDRNTYWSRPHYLAPHTSDTELLRCCRRVYSEARSLPWVSAEHTFWLTGRDRIPSQQLDRARFEKILKRMHAQHGDVDLNRVRFFGELCLLEDVDCLNGYLDLNHFHPRCVTITIRHTDWRYWEDDERLYIDSQWVNQCKFPSSLRCLKMELESLERKKDQIDTIVAQMQETWVLTRKDDVYLSAKRTPVGISRWKGSSMLGGPTWSGQRWIRDEVEPETLNYYIATITWLPEPSFQSKEPAEPIDTANIAKQLLINTSPCALSVSELIAAEVPPGTDGLKASHLVEQWRLRMYQARANRGIVECRRPRFRYN